MTRRNPLAGKRVLITRPEHQSGAFARSLSEVGASPIVAPVVEIVPPDDPDSVRAAVRDLNSYDWLVLTSVNGVSAFFGALDSFSPGVRDLKLKLAAIGPRTAHALALHGVRAALVPEEYVAEALADKLLAVLPKSARILLLRAAEARDVLPERLRAAGHSVSDVAVYRTRIRRDDNLAKKVRACDILTFTSPSTVKGFAENGALGEVGTKVVACIGPVTAQAARAAGMNVTVVAREYTVDGLLAALLDRLQSTGSVSAR